MTVLDLSELMTLDSQALVEWLRAAGPDVAVLIDKMTSPRVACGGPQRAFRDPWSGEQWAEHSWCPHHPTPRQRAFLALPGREALYGGAAGGGKSDAGLMGAAQYVCVPGYNAIVFRQTYGQLSQDDGLIERAHEWWGPHGAHYHAGEHRWTFPSGASITFGSLQHEQDRHKYQGAAYQYVFFDELTNFPTERAYRYLFSRLRKPTNDSGNLAACPGCGLTVADVPLRMRAGTNPGGPGEGWVFRRLVKPWLDWRNGTGPKPDAIFVPARARDNPHLDYDSYLEMLAVLDPIERARLEDGEWDIRTSGGYFDRSTFRRCTLDDLPEVDGRDVRQCRYWDKAGTDDTGGDPDWTAGARVLWRKTDNRFWVADMVRFRGEPGEVERRIRETAERDGRLCPIVIEQEPGSSGKDSIHNYRTRVLRGFPTYGDRPTGSKEERATLWSARAFTGDVVVVDGYWTTEFFDEIEPFPSASVHDDQVDAVSGACAWLSRGTGRGGLGG